MWNEFSCTKLQLPPEPMTRGLPPPDPRWLCPLSLAEFVEAPHPEKKFLGTPLLSVHSISQIPKRATNRTALQIRKTLQDGSIGNEK